MTLVEQWVEEMVKVSARPSQIGEISAIGGRVFAIDRSNAEVAIVGDCAENFWRKRLQLCHGEGLSSRVRNKRAGYSALSSFNSALNC